MKIILYILFAIGFFVNLKNPIVVEKIKHPKKKKQMIIDCELCGSSDQGKRHTCARMQICTNCWVQHAPAAYGLPL